jgi:isoquinoline 1-oxidoreductase alpha subunit
MLTLNVNGKKRQFDGDPDTPMVWVIRDELGLTGTKFGCGVASCGACTVHLDGEPVRSCQVTAEDAVGSDITTIEGLSGQVAATVRDTWREHDVVQCGYCQSGQIVSAVGLLTATPNPSDEDIDEYMNGNVCRCATYHRIRAAIHAAAAKLEV